MVNKYKVDMVAISEPMVNKNKVEGYKRYLGFNQCLVNSNGQIWCFWRNNCTVDNIQIHDQLVTFKFQQNGSNHDYYVTIVYAKCTAAKRMDLWHNLEDLDNSITSPWLGSDHRPMLLKCFNDNSVGIKYFKFLDFWIDQDDFKTLVAKEWQVEVDGNPMWRLQQKLKNLGRRLSKWSIEEIGDVNENADEWEAKMEFLEEMDLIDNSKTSREELNKGHAEYVYWLNKQESILKQKSHIRWFEEGERNTKYFHAVIIERRRKLEISRIMNNKGNWISGEDKIANKPVRYFEKLFNLRESNVDPQILDCIPECITDDNNNYMMSCSEEEEIKDVVFNMSTDSAAGPDRYSRIFYYCCWDIITREVVEFVQFFFIKGKLTKFFSTLFWFLSLK
ncbi:uncharacterized protein LOC132611422 [Lycium barbarum]|uniref:uncharacterized protein LOC132611422 n=1 Tax=Lycium barbarum TaxID=112863 RepID=UPI00293F335C|nr:uncharacterized protein LOC132611422 [Lycium barbarum]